MAPQLLLTDSTTDQEIATSAIASHVCDAYITTAAQHISQNGPAVQMTPGYLHAVRRACVIDVTVTGDAEVIFYTFSFPIINIHFHYDV